MEEREQIYKRESAYLESSKASSEAELETNREIIIRMENHINMLNTLLLPYEFVKRLVEPKSQYEGNLYGSDYKQDSDSSYDDMLADYGSVSIPKANEPQTKNSMLQKNSAHIDHIDFMNCQKSIKEAKREYVILRNQNEVLHKHNEIDEILIKQLSTLAASSFSNKGATCKSHNSQSSIDARNAKIVSILMEGKNDDLGLDDRSKLKILKELSNQSEHNDDCEATILYKKLSLNFKNELDDTLSLNQNYESMMKIKSQQIQSLHNLALKTFSESFSPSNSDKQTSLSEKFNELEAKHRRQMQKYTEIVAELKTLQTTPTNEKAQEAERVAKLSHAIEVVQLHNEIEEAWAMVDRVNQRGSTLLATNKELHDELNAYKMFFTSKYDTLERESSSAYHTLLSLKQENSLLVHKIEK